MNPKRDGLMQVVVDGGDLLGSGLDALAHLGMRWNRQMRGIDDAKVVILVNYLFFLFPSWTLVWLLSSVGDVIQDMQTMLRRILVCRQVQ